MSSAVNMFFKFGTYVHTNITIKQIHFDPFSPHYPTTATSDIEGGIHYIILHTVASPALKKWGGVQKNYEIF